MNRYSNEIVKHIHFPIVESTNLWAKENISQWDKTGITLITASAQTAGYGRFKKKWISPPGVNLYVTFCFWMESNRKDISQISQLLALAAQQVLTQSGFQANLKWPNDILINQKKVAGILCETVSNENLRGMICGIGINGNMLPEHLKQIHRPSTSLFVEKGEEVDLSILLLSLNSLFSSFLTQFMQRGFAPFFTSFYHALGLKENQPVCFHIEHNRLIKATFNALHEDGSIALLLEDGTLQTFYSGEFVDL
jgi:BirA family biotin operon repressor/biotin-[acetyl-CoA-carboxylase] ligase